MKKRVLSILLAALMMLSFLPVMASAITSVKSVALTVTAPAAGAAPKFTVTVGNSSLYNIWSGDNAIEWYDVNTDTYLASGNKFAAGHTYRVIIWLECEMDCYFPVTSGKPTTTATVNGKTATVNKAYEQDPAEVIEVTYDFTVPAVKVSSVAITGVATPVAGGKPNYKATVSGTGYEAYDEANFEVQWFDKTNNGKELMYDDVFVAGHTYTASIWVKAKDGYEFATSSGKPSVTAKINGQTATVNKAYEQDPAEVIEVTYDFTINKTKVSSVAITGVASPVAGGKPNYKATVSGTGYEAYDEANFEVQWFDKTNNGKELMYDDVFVAGHTYTASIWVKAKDGYEFATSSGKPSVTAKINGQTATVNKAYEQDPAEVIEVTYDFTVESSATTTKIASVTVTGVTEPKADRTPIFDAKINANANYEAYEKSLITAITWFDVTDNKTVNSVDTFKAGHTYRFTIKLQAKANCEFKVDSSNAPQVTGKVNAYTATVAKSGSLDPKQVIELSYEFKLDGEPDISFPDVKETDWFYDVVQYCAKKGYITGYGNGKFGPNDNLKRQDFVCILARIDGADLSKYENVQSKLSDVQKGAYYAAAVNWAVDNGYINGYKNGKFGVNDSITREQVATILYNYMGKPVVKNVDETLSKFPDANKISSFAKEPMAWAVQNGIISGMGNGTVASTSGATRAQIAAIIQRMDSQGMFIK